MITYDKFLGINNVLSPRMIAMGQLQSATNVDVTRAGKVRRRDFLAVVSADSLHSIFRSDGGRLLGVAGSDLVVADTGGVLAEGVGTSRMWFLNLPGDRVAYSNGAAFGVIDGGVARAWGVPTPPADAAAQSVPGGLHPGDYSYWLTYVRTSDGLEGAPRIMAPVTLPDGGLVLTGLPQLVGHSINVYLSPQFGGEAYLAGNAAGSVFSFTGASDKLVMPCRTMQAFQPPAGRLLACWRGRVLVAAGSVLYASMPGRYESFDVRRDYKVFDSTITLVQPVTGGIYVGTEKELAFLAGSNFDELAFSRSTPGRVVLGSGASVDGGEILLGDGTGQGDAMICIVDGALAAGFSDGTMRVMTEGVYQTAVIEVSASFRKSSNGDPLYIAVPL